MKINSVEIEIGGNKISLTLKQIAELKKILAEAFPEPEIKTVFIPGPERIVERTRPYAPFYAPNPTWKQWEVTCEAGQMRLKTP